MQQRRDGPRGGAPGPPGPDELFELVRRWIDFGYTVGFPRRSLAATEFYRHSPIGVHPPENLEAMIAKYLIDVSTLLRSTPATAMGVSQDGQTRRYAVDGESEYAELHVGRVGSVSLATYRPEHASLPARPSANGTESA